MSSELRRTAGRPALRPAGGGQIRRQRLVQCRVVLSDGRRTDCWACLGGASVAEFQAGLRNFLDGSETICGGWVVDGNYGSRVGDLLDQADTVVWLDYPRLLVLARVVRRTCLRQVLRQELWNGNRESWRNMLSIRPAENIILSSWTRHGHYRQRYE